MLGFKEYALLTFNYSFIERTRNHFLKYIGPDLLLYIQDRAFLLGLTDKNGDKTKGIEYFIEEINKASSIYSELYSSFRGSAGIGLKLKYYRLAAYYTKLSGLTLNGIQNKDLAVESDNAIKEIFAEKLYDYLLAIHATSGAGSAVDDAKSAIKKTFVPDLITPDSKTGSNLTTPNSSLLYENSTTTFEGRLFTVKEYTCLGTNIVDDWPYIQRCGTISAGTVDMHTSDKCFGLAGCTPAQKGKIARLKKLVALYKQNNNIEDTSFPNSDGFPYKISSFKSSNLGDYKENQFFPGVSLPTTKETTFLELFSRGTYVEYFFKFDFDELVSNMMTNQNYEKGITNIFHKYTAVPYYSLEKFSQLIRLIYLWASKETAPSINKTPSQFEIDKAFEKTKIEFGARLVLSTPNLLNETNSDKIHPVYSLDTYESTFDSSKWADGSANHGIASAYDKILTKAITFSKSESPPLQSAWQNKTFIYNFLQKKEKLAGSFHWDKAAKGGVSIPAKNEYNKVTKEYEVYLDDIDVIPVYSFPLAESTIKLTNSDKKEFLLDFYDGTHRVGGIPNVSLDQQGMQIVNFSLDQAVVGKYSQTILDNLFEDKTVKQFFNSTLVGRKHLNMADPEAYKQMILSAPTSEEVESSTPGSDEKKVVSTPFKPGDPRLLSLFKNTTEQKAFIISCDSTDDKIDQNLITVVDSIEGL